MSIGFALKLPLIFATQISTKKWRLKREGINFKRVKAVYSSEIQIKESLKLTDGSNFKRSFYGTISYMPGLFGLYGASEVIRYFMRKEQ